MQRKAFRPQAVWVELPGLCDGNSALCVGMEDGNSQGHGGGNRRHLTGWAVSRTGDRSVAPNVQLGAACPRLAVLVPLVWVGVARESSRSGAGIVVTGVERVLLR